MYYQWREKKKFFKGGGRNALRKVRNINRAQQLRGERRLAGQDTIAPTNPNRKFLRLHF